jgi:hypothetical protein
MPTTLTAPIHAGRSYTIRFKNDVNSTGVILLMAGWVPKNQSNVPSARSVAIAAGAEGELTGSVPGFAAVRRLTLAVSLDAGEKGKLEVLEDGAAHTTVDVTQTTTFEMPVDP